MYPVAAKAPACCTESFSGGLLTTSANPANTSPYNKIVWI